MASDFVPTHNIGTTPDESQGKQRTDDRGQKKGNERRTSNIEL
jgi:hypothetical protein